MSDFSGKVALVTGGSRGLGEFIAEALVKAGAKVYVSSRKADACEATAQRLSRFGECISAPADLGAPEGVQGLADEILAREPKLHILINNAGATWGAPFEDFPESGWDKVMDLNVRSIFFLTQRLLPRLAAAALPTDPSRIVNIGSIAGTHAGGGNNYSYKASKSAVHHLTRMLAAEFGPKHITVNAVAPGPFETKMMAFALDDPDQRSRIERSIPLGRVGGPDDISGVITFLCSRAGAYVSGAVIPLDGGSAAAA